MILNKYYKILILTLLIAVCVNIVLANINVNSLTTDINGRNVTFSCFASVIDQANDKISKIELYTNTTGTWEVNQTYQEADCVDQLSCTATFLVENIANGTFEWNCLAYNASSPPSTNFSEQNATFTINVNDEPVNNPPVLDKDIESISWNENNNKTFDLSAYFSDPDNDNLTFGYVAKPDNITIVFHDNMATLIPDKDWTGMDSIIFTASDGTSNTESNVIRLAVLPDNDNTVTNSNEPPVIIPITDSDNINITGSKEFSINVTDPDNDTLSITWYLDNAPVASNVTTYKLSDISQGEHVLTVKVYDGTNSSIYEWTVTYLKMQEETLNQSVIINESVEEFCGDGACNNNEDCNTCVSDCSCPDGKQCNSEGRCEKSNNVLIYVIMGFIFIAVMAFIVTKILRKKRTTEQQPPQEQPKPVTQQPVQQQPTIQPQQNQVQTPQQQEPIIQPPQIQQQEPKSEQLKEDKEWKPDLPPTESKPTIPEQANKPNLSAVQEYILKMRKQGHSDEEIRSKLRKSGWPDYKIAMEFLTLDKK